MTKVDETIKVRDAEYGGFENMARISQDMKVIARDTPGWKRMNPHQREATDMIIHKLGRMLAGNPNNFDGWHDIQGYAKLVEDRLPKVVPEWDAPGQVVALLDAAGARFTVLGHHEGTSFLKSHQSLGPPYLFIQRRQLQRVQDEAESLRGEPDDE